MKKMSEYAMAYVGVSFKLVDSYYFPNLNENVNKSNYSKVRFDTVPVSGHPSLLSRATFFCLFFVFVFSGSIFWFINVFVPSLPQSKAINFALVLCLPFVMATCSVAMVTSFPA